MSNNNYIFKLASNSVPKLDCPHCGAVKHWQRYIYSETNSPLPDEFGKCDNESKCGAWNDPYKDKYFMKLNSQLDNHVPHTKNSMNNNKSSKHLLPFFIPHNELIATLNPGSYTFNTFIQNLIHNIPFPFSIPDIEKIISLYYLGTISSGYRKGAITFPFIDINKNIRAVQVKQFNNKNSTTSTDFLHSIIEKDLKYNKKPIPDWLNNYNNNNLKVSCLFGEHLLNKFPYNPIALVEAPKTAIYCTLYFGFPDNPCNFLWIAVYNKSSFSIEKIKVLQNRDIYTFPDLSIDSKTFNEWKQKAIEFENKLSGTKFIFSDLLERLAPDTYKANGSDIADILINLDWEYFRNTLFQLPNNSVFNLTESSEKNLSCEKREKCEPLENNIFSDKINNSFDNTDQSLSFAIQLLRETPSYLPTFANKKLLQYCINYKIPYSYLN